MSIIAIFEVNNDKGAFPTGALPAGEFPAGAFPTGAYPAGAFPTGAFPTGAYPTGAFPTGAFPTGAAGNIKTCKKFLDTQYLYDETVSDALTGLIRTKKVCRLIGQSLIAVVAKDSFTASIGFKTIILASNDPNHLWPSCRNFNEVKYELHLYKDDKSRVLFDKPIVWPVTQLVPTMDQMLAGPGTK